MPLLSRKVDYALLILSYLHHQPQGGSAREIAAEFDLSRAFVANILKLLCHKGFVVSHRGVKGGYALARPAADIGLRDVMDALDDRFHLSECCRPEPESACGLTHRCPIRRAINALHCRLRDTLTTVTLADLVSPVEESTGMQIGILVSGE
jgi:Rrf2 family cysteine metabolism transcriptional repressor